MDINDLHTKKRETETSHLSLTDLYGRQQHKQVALRKRWWSKQMSNSVNQRRQLSIWATRNPVIVSWVEPKSNQGADFVFGIISVASSNVFALCPPKNRRR